MGFLFFMLLMASGVHSSPSDLAKIEISTGDNDVVAVADHDGIVCWHRGIGMDTDQIIQYSPDFFVHTKTYPPPAVDEAVQMNLLRTMMTLPWLSLQRFYGPHLYHNNRLYCNDTSQFENETYVKSVDRGTRKPPKTPTLVAEMREEWFYNKFPYGIFGSLDTYYTPFGNLYKSMDISARAASLDLPESELKKLYDTIEVCGGNLIVYLELRTYVEDEEAVVENLSGEPMKMKYRHESEFKVSVRLISTNERNDKCEESWLELGDCDPKPSFGPNGWEKKSCDHCFPDGVPPTKKNWSPPYPVLDWADFDF